MGTDLGTTLRCMEEDEAAQRAAEHKTAALYNLGWWAGTGAAVWARTAQDELARHESARERWGSGQGEETWKILHGCALAIAMAIDQVLKFAHRVWLLTGDPELSQARERFDGVVPDAEALRDLVAHQEAYAVGRGHRQIGKKEPPISESHPATFIYWTDATEPDTSFNLAGESLSLRAAVHAAVELADVVERVRLRHEERTAVEANAALRRRYGLPLE
jgi:hypothetical protein